MDETQKDVSELSAEIAGQKVNLKSVALNTLATVATLIGVAVLIVFMWRHEADAREAGKSFIEAVKEQTVVQREQTQVMREANCLVSLPPERKHLDATFCKQVTR